MYECICCYFKKYWDSDIDVYTKKLVVGIDQPFATIYQQHDPATTRKYIKSHLSL